MIRLWILSVVACVVLASCGGAPLVSRQATVDLPNEMRTFAPRAPALSVKQANRDILRDFLDLTFALESGQSLTKFTRFEGPVTVAFTNPASQPVSRELDALIKRLQNEANIAISPRLH